MSSEIENEIRHTWWTVFGFWHESWERWSGQFDVPTARMAEDLAVQSGREQGLNLAVVAVVSGQVGSEDLYATWVHPDVTSQEEMDEVLRGMGYIPQQSKKKRWF
jgi:hypothetical protein